MSILKHKDNDDFREPAVYSTTGFKDTLASPLFYSIAVVALVLGIASIFGFLQNPLKLKAVASAVHNKVHIGSPVSSSPKHDLYSLNQSFKQKTDNQSTPKFVQDFEALLIETQKQTESQTQNSHSGLQRVSFNYDVTASDFWTDLDTTRLESAIEESDRHDFEASLLGAPLESEYHQQLEKELMPLNDSIYTLKTTPTRI